MNKIYKWKFKINNLDYFSGSCQDKSFMFIRINDIIKKISTKNFSKVILEIKEDYEQEDSLDQKKE